jgi:DnaK suppressor protein
MTTRYAPAAAPPATPTAARPAWHSLLEERWQQRLTAVTELALAYHDAEERAGQTDPAEAKRLRKLLRDATKARRALGDTEAALSRLADGSFGRCERCEAPLPTAELLAEPETRYCAECVAVSWVALAG